MLRFHNDPPAAIVGVVKNSKYFSLGEKDLPAVFWPDAQSPRAAVNLNFMLRTRQPESILKKVNKTLGAIDTTAAIDVKPMDRALGLALLPSRAGAVLLGSLGVLGLLLAAIGLYGLLMYSVSRRIREIGIRIALGARPGNVGYLVCRSSLGIVGTGLAVGGLISYFAASPLAMFLVPELNPHDSISLTAVFATLVLAALAATFPPLIRALRIGPIEALRYE
jgi:ABC-type antimicrobial peptide transport system permease subunit